MIPEETLKKKKHNWDTTTAVAFCKNCLIWCTVNGSQARVVDLVPCRKNGKIQKNQQKKDPELLQQVIAYQRGYN